MLKIFQSKKYFGFIFIYFKNFLNIYLKPLKTLSIVFKNKKINQFVKIIFKILVFKNMLRYIFIFKILFLLNALPIFNNIDYQTSNC